jgi:hypothetical protein
VAVKYHRLSLTVLLFWLALFGCDSPEDQSEGKAVVDRVHEQIRDGNYSALYHASAQRFKDTGPEDKFVEVMQQHRSKAGALKKAAQVAYETGFDSNAGKVYAFVSDLEFDNGRVRERLTLTRADSGKMQLSKLEWSPLQ